MGSALRCGISIGAISVVNLPAFGRRRRLVVALRGELVLRRAGDVVLAGDQLGGVAHVEVLVDIPQAVGDHHVDELVVAKAHPLARVAQEIGRVGHRLHSARDVRGAVAGADGLRGERDRLEAGAADLVDRERGDRRIEAGLERRLARRVLPDSRLQHVAQDDLVDLIGLDTGALRSRP